MFDEYFRKAGEIFKSCGKLYAAGTAEERSLLLKGIYADFCGSGYAESFANPDYAAACFEKETGQVLAAFYALTASLPRVCMAGDERGFLLVEGLFKELEGICREKSDIYLKAKNLFADFHKKNLVFFAEQRAAQMFEGLPLAKHIIEDLDLSGGEYLWQYGENIPKGTADLAEYMAGLDEDTVDTMAGTLTEGYVRGFLVTGRDLSKKKYVQIRYELGFERMVRAVSEKFAETGLECIYTPRTPWLAMRLPGELSGGYCVTGGMSEFLQDHLYDQALFMDDAFAESFTDAMEKAYENHRAAASMNAGPALIEAFGEKIPSPVIKQTAVKADENVKRVAAALRTRRAELADRYEPSEETSFSIIAFPTPAIGRDFDGIFRETVRINTLPNDMFVNAQQDIIKTLDRAERVHVTGRGENQTDITVTIRQPEDLSAQTAFENCTADVNIPAGEVFTSPVLSGTEGLLHVLGVQIDDVWFEDLKIRFKDGMAVEYSCANYEDAQKGRQLILQKILKEHDVLPMGEFAIGTNTAASSMARRLHIEDRLPILIAEKTGPHFALGDTCYSFCEDVAVKNPDGREIIARDNEISIQRKTDPQKAYFGCHTDITIPYAQLGDVTGIGRDKKEYPVIKQGKFVCGQAVRLNDFLEKVPGDVC